MLTLHPRFAKLIGLPPLLGLLIFIQACGTQVETGRNKIPQTYGFGSSSAGLDNFDKNSCFGAKDELPASIETFCNSSFADTAVYAKFTSLLCEKKKLYNLTKPECGWNGEGDPQNFLLPIEHTPLDNVQARRFQYMSAYSLTLDPSDKSLKDLLFFAYSDPDGFKKKYFFPENTEVRPLTAVTRQGNVQRIDYEMNLKTSAIIFQSRMTATVLAAGFEVITEEIITDKPKQGISQRDCLYLSFELPDRRRKVMILEEFEVSDNGVHPIAFKILKKHDVTRMRLFYDVYKVND